jgi:hypothetical protein
MTYAYGVGKSHRTLIVIGAKDTPNDIACKLISYGVGHADALDVKCEIWNRTTLISLKLPECSIILVGESGSALQRVAIYVVSLGAKGTRLSALQQKMLVAALEQDSANFS